MDKKSQHITYLIWNSLRDAINDVRGLKAGARQSFGIRYKRIVYSEEHDLVVVEIDRNQFQGLNEGFFETIDLKDALLTHSNCKWVDVVDLGTNINFYFGLRSDVKQEPIEVPSLVYAI